MDAAQASGRDHPVPVLSERALARLKKEAALAGAVAEQEREAAGLEAIGHKRTADEMAPPAEKRP